MLQSAQNYRASARAITIYNSLGGGRAVLNPIDQDPVHPEVKMYICGLTPQDHPHMGHGLTSIRFDIVHRYLEYRRLNVRYVQNVTDIDDKIITKVISTGRDPIQMTRDYTDEFYQCLKDLHVLPVDRLTRVTEFVPEIIVFIQKLIEKGFAYSTPEGNVYFNVSKKDDYGKLSNQNTTMLFESVRKELDKQKHSPLDFALWKRDDSTALSRPSPWGVGRPGWHIECSVMIHETLGDRIDIHGGAIDLKFPHHENEIAQSEAYSGDGFATIWMHTGLLNIEGQKMSKSLHNFVRLVDGIEQFGVTPLRFAVARHHYRSSIDLSAKLFRDNLNSLLHFHRLFARVPTEGIELSLDALDAEAKKTIEEFEAAMDNDFNSPEALVTLEKAQAKITQELDREGASSPTVVAHVKLLRELGGILGLFFDNLERMESEGLRLAARVVGVDPLTREQVAAILSERTEARSAKNFAKSDELRQRLISHGVDVLDTKSGSSWRFA